MWRHGRWSPSCLVHLKRLVLTVVNGHRAFGAAAVRSPEVVFSMGMMAKAGFPETV